MYLNELKNINLISIGIDIDIFFFYAYSLEESYETCMHSDNFYITGFCGECPG